MASSILEQFAELKSDYEIGKASRYKRAKTGIMTLGSHADYHYRTEAASFGAMEMARQWAVTDGALHKAVQRADSLLVSLGYMPAGEVNSFAHAWHGQELPYIQPVDDATADILQAKGLLSSPRRLAASRGIDFGDLTELRTVARPVSDPARRADANARAVPQDGPAQARSVLPWGRVDRPCGQPTCRWLSERLS